MADQSDIQTPIFSSYKGWNKFTCWFSVKDRSVTNTSEIRADLKEFVKKVLEYFDEYNIPKLECELLGYHLDNLQDALRRLDKIPLDAEIFSAEIKSKHLSIESPSDELTKKQKRICIDIDRKIRRLLTGFPRVNFLEHAFDDYFDQIEKNPETNCWKLPALF